MQENPLLLLCGLFCIYPLVIFGIPAFMIGRVWGRYKLRTPLESVDRQPMKPNVLRKSAPPSDKVGYGPSN